MTSASIRLRRIVACIAFAACLALGGCKARINPHRAPEADAELVLAQSIDAGKAPSDAYPAGSKKIVLSINNYPGADQPLEQDIVQREFEMFERKNPDIRIEYSTWRFTPESFFERARNRMLTDIVEVDAAQMPAIINLNYAADITGVVADEPAFKDLNPAVTLFAVKDRRIYGVPVDLNTVALFFNRPMVEIALHGGSAGTTVPKEREKGKGAGGDPKQPLFDDPFPDTPKRIEVAQLPWFRRGWLGGRGRQQQEAQQQEQQQQQSGSQDDSQTNRRGTATRRGRQEVMDYYNLREQPRPGSYYDVQDQADRAGDATAKPPTRKRSEPDTTASAGGKTRRTIDNDVITTAEEAELAVAETTPKERETTIVRTAGLPTNWPGVPPACSEAHRPSGGHLRLRPSALRRRWRARVLPVGRAGRPVVQSVQGESISIDVNTSAAADVAQYLKDLRWRYDISPPVEKCYADNVVRMFAEGKVAMVMLPATRDTIRRLLRLGMPLESIGISILPAGPRNRDHLMNGRCLMLNSQLDRDKRAAAVKWLMFQLDPEVMRMREQYFYREQEMTGGPRVPLFVKSKEDELYQTLKRYRTLPLFGDYEDGVAGLLRPEPPYFTDKFYAAISEGVRPIVQRKDSVPVEEVGTVCADFDHKYLRDAPTPGGLQRYLEKFTEFATR